MESMGDRGSLDVFIESVDGAFVFPKSEGNRRSRYRLTHWRRLATVAKASWVLQTTKQVPTNA